MCLYKLNHSITLTILSSFINKNKKNSFFYSYTDISTKIAKVKTTKHLKLYE